MQKSAALNFLSAQMPIIIERFDVKQLAVFGSTARDEARDDSDLDLLVEFAHPLKLDNYLGLIKYIESNLAVKVDIGQLKYLKETLKPYVMKDIIYVTHSNS